MFPISPSKTLTAPTTPGTSLSFVLSTSLPIFKRLTWEQTPWVRPQLSPAIAQTISKRLSPLYPYLTLQAIRNALPFGVSYDSMHNRQKHEYPNLYIIFPDSQRDIREDARLLKIWHDEIVKPAFDEAWKESRLVKTRQRPDGTTYTKYDAIPASDILERLSRGRNAAVHATWPDWMEKGEDVYEDRRMRIFNDAWVSIKDMLHGHSDLKEMQDPVLLAVWEFRAVADVGVDADAESLVDTVKEEWKVYADYRFFVSGTFNVVVEEN